MPHTIPDRKPEIIALLRLLVSEEQLLAYERDVPHVDITRELPCLWFDDQYHPDDTFFISCFSPDELAALEDFHSYYRQWQPQLPESHGTIRTWLASPLWREIMSRAQQTAARLST